VERPFCRGELGAGRGARAGGSRRGRESGVGRRPDAIREHLFNGFAGLARAAAIRRAVICPLASDLGLIKRPAHGLF